MNNSILWAEAFNSRPRFFFITLNLTLILTVLSFRPFFFSCYKQSFSKFDNFFLHVLFVLEGTVITFEKEHCRINIYINKEFLRRIVKSLIIHQLSFQRIDTQQNHHQLRALSPSNSFFPPDFNFCCYCYIFFTFLFFTFFLIFSICDDSGYPLVRLSVGFSLRVIFSFCRLRMLPLLADGASLVGTARAPLPWPPPSLPPSPPPPLPRAPAFGRFTSGYAGILVGFMTW